MDNKENDKTNVPMTTEEASSPAIASSQSDMETVLQQLQQIIATEVSKIQKEMATKEDIDKIREEMATKEEIAEIREEMATKEEIAKIREEMATKKDVTTITDKLDRLLVATPAAAIPEGNFVLSPPREDFAAPVIQGGRWTFSLVKHRSSEDNDYRYFVVSCAHCALRQWFYEGEADETTDSVYLTVPKKVMNVAQRVGFVFTEDSKLRDFVAIEVNLKGDNPTGVKKEDALEWPNNNQATVELGRPNSSAGHSHSAPVRGQNVVHGNDGNFHFVADSREKGNSGAIMFLENRTLVGNNQVHVLGLFKGTKDIGRKGEYEERGAILPFPNFDNVQFGELQGKGKRICPGS